MRLPDLVSEIKVCDLWRSNENLSGGDKGLVFGISHYRVLKQGHQMLTLLFSEMQQQRLSDRLHLIIFLVVVIIFDDVVHGGHSQ